MTKSEEIKNHLIKEFGYLEPAARTQGPRRIFMEAGADKFSEVFGFISEGMKPVMLSAITGLDEGEGLGFIYHLSRADGVIINLKTTAPKTNPVLKSVTRYFPSADVYERELRDLFGAKIEGLVEGNRYPLTDDWPAGEYPLRKDWKKKEVKDAL
ncbi:MAG: NADH-quinone oxidoreductase subunit C [Candidatus Omnitrophota bacterium]